MMNQHSVPEVSSGQLGRISRTKSKAAKVRIGGAQVVLKKSPVLKTRFYIPERLDIILIDFEPTRGGEVGKYRPALVLSSKEHNQKTGLLICCPVSTSIRGHVSEVPVEGLERPCVVVSSIIQTFDWQIRKARFIKKASHEIFEAVLQRFIPLIGVDEFFGDD